MNFVALWGVVLILNQIVFWRACMRPDCLIAAIPGTLIISTIVWFVFKRVNK
jgi:hypothetical protein